MPPLTPEEEAELQKIVDAAVELSLESRYKPTPAEVMACDQCRQDELF